MGSMDVIQLLLSYSGCGKELVRNNFNYNPDACAEVELPSTRSAM